MRRLAIVPARGGSKRLPGKNVRLLDGRPLINHTVEAARECFDHVIVSSDSLDVLAVVEPAPNVEALLRSASLSTDESKVIDTVLFHFSECASDEYDQIWLCLPTCPLRTAEDILSGMKLLSTDIDGVVSVAHYEFPPSLALSLDNGLLRGMFSDNRLARGDSRSQDQAVAFRPNGAFYGMWWTSFERHRNFFRGKVRGYPMPRERSVDVDHEMDFVTAQAILNWTLRR